VRGRRHGARHGDEYEAATELNNVRLLGMELARLILALVLGIQDLTSGGVLSRHGAPDGVAFCSFCSLGDQSCGLHCRFVGLSTVSFS
jgi:hypothetical protein